VVGNQGGAWDVLLPKDVLASPLVRFSLLDILKKESSIDLNRNGPRRWGRLEQEQIRVDRSGCLNWGMLSRATWWQFSLSYENSSVTKSKRNHRLWWDMGSRWTIVQVCGTGNFWQTDACRLTLGLTDASRNVLIASNDGMGRSRHLLTWFPSLGINQSIHQSINQSINQSVGRPVAGACGARASPKFTRFTVSPHNCRMLHWEDFCGLGHAAPCCDWIQLSKSCCCKRL
jgi:hypothetical protein